MRLLQAGRGARREPGGGAEHASRAHFLELSRTGQGGCGRSPGKLPRGSSASQTRSAATGGPGRGRDPQFNPRPASGFRLRPGPAQLWARLRFGLGTGRLDSGQSEFDWIGFYDPVPCPLLHGWGRRCRPSQRPDGGRGPSRLDGVSPPPQGRVRTPAKPQVSTLITVLFCNFNYVISDTLKNHR